MAVQENAGSFSIAYRRAQHNKDLYHFYPEQLETEGMPNWDLDSSLRQFRVALCATLDAEDAVRKHCGAEQTTTEDCTPALAWTLAYDTLMLNVWHNELQEKGVSIRCDRRSQRDDHDSSQYSFRPRWSAFPTTAELANLEFPLIIPDVVFSIRIHVSHPRLKEAFKYHPAYVFSHGVSRPEYLDIPILVVEYKKVVSHSDDDHGIEEHSHHLSGAMTAALPLYSVLGIDTPLCGLFLKQYGVDTFLGTVRRTDKGGLVSRIQSVVYLLFHQNAPSSLVSTQPSSMRRKSPVRNNLIFSIEHSMFFICVQSSLIYRRAQGAFLPNWTRSRRVDNSSHVIGPTNRFSVQRKVASRNDE